MVPHEEAEYSHWILDAVFCECYTRWSGASTLIIPTDGHCFLHQEEYEQWLELYDPDFIYSYVQLEQELVDRIDGKSCPISFEQHERRGPGEPRWQDFFPHWHLNFEAVPSLSVIHSPYAGNRRSLASDKERNVPTLITQWRDFDKYRFIPDNFGATLDLDNYPNPVSGLFETLCYTPEVVSEHTAVGTNKTTSIADILQQIASSKVLPIVRLAMIHAGPVPRAISQEWSHKFSLFVGTSCLDRIHMWNARNLCRDSFDVVPGLLVSNEQLQDEDCLKALGQFLDRRNFMGQHNSPAWCAVRSFTHSSEELAPLVEQLRTHTYNHVVLNEGYNAPAIPTPNEVKKSYKTKLTDTMVFRLSDDTNTIQAREPEHFTFIPSRFGSTGRGQWMVELEIERHNDLSRFSNVVDVWMLPRRHCVVGAFTRNPARVSKDHLLALLPSTGSFSFGFEPIRQRLTYDLSLPDDENLFEWLLLEHHLPGDDLRSGSAHRMYEDIAISDKGQNLRGVISMFGHLSGASELLTNHYWRNVLREWKGRSDNNKARTLSHFEGLLPSSRESKEKLQTQLHFRDIGLVGKYLSANLKDTLELLIEKRVFFRVYQWRCSYCGHANSRTFDDVKESNNCDICAKPHNAPLDIEWKYELNDFVYRSLCERNGLTVLWALGHLQQKTWVHSFYYLPEVDLYPNHDNRETKNEIDALCVFGGKFLALEAKKSAASLIEKPQEISKFTEKIRMLRPDAAWLVFEQYCESETDLTTTKARLGAVVKEIAESVGTRTIVNSIVASDFPDFNEHPVDLGYSGWRVDEVFESREKQSDTSVAH